MIIKDSLLIQTIVYAIRYFAMYIVYIYNICETLWLVVINPEPPTDHNATKLLFQWVSAPYEIEIAYEM
jgi:Ni,Fe-hydrogenase I large subunit